MACALTASWNSRFITTLAAYPSRQLPTDFAEEARFYLAPAWCEDPTPAGRMRLEMRPGLVYGGGDHPTTQLCLELLEQANVSQAAAADVGCGTGILAQAAILLGVARVVCCDIDPDAAAEAHRAGLPAFEGSAGAIRTGSIDLVLANLPTGNLLTLLPEFTRILAPGGRAVLSGFLCEQRGMVYRETAAAGWTLAAERLTDEWAAALFKWCGRGRLSIA